MADSVATHSVFAACRQILESGSLAAKLAALPTFENAREPRRPWSPLHLDAPARDTEIKLVSQSEALPRPGRLRDPAARALCLARFAHHELMAVELFAWALLRWPMVPSTLLRDWVQILGEEQRHCRLYLARLEAHGMALSETPCSDYFWRHCAGLKSPKAFLAAMGLTLEQANLDFTLRFADAFRRAGDTESAGVLERVHADEIRHVAAAAHWLRRLDPEAPDEIARYEGSVPFPLSAARAKGRPFSTDARKQAGLEESFIDHVRAARSSQERAGKRASLR